MPAGAQRTRGAHAAGGAPGRAGPAWLSPQPRPPQVAPGTISLLKAAACDPKAERPGFQAVPPLPTDRSEGQGLQTQVTTTSGYRAPQHPSCLLRGGLLTEPHSPTCIPGSPSTTGPQADLEAPGLAWQVLNPVPGLTRPQPWMSLPVPRWGQWANSRPPGLMGASIWSEKDATVTLGAAEGTRPPTPTPAHVAREECGPGVAQIFDFFKRSQKSGPLHELCQLFKCRQPIPKTCLELCGPNKTCLLAKAGLQLPAEGLRRGLEVANKRHFFGR